MKQYKFKKLAAGVYYFFLAFIVLALLGLFSVNIKNVKAAASCTVTDCTITESGRIVVGSDGSQTFFPTAPGTSMIDLPASSNLIIDGSGVFVSAVGNLNFKNLTVQNNAVLTHDEIDNVGMSPSYTDKFTVKWTGYLNFPSDTNGVSALVVTSDNNSFIKIDDVSNGSSNGSWSVGSADWTGSNMTSSVPAGLHKVELYYAENTGLANISLAFRGTSLWEKSLVGRMFVTNNISGTKGLTGSYYIKHTIADPFSGSPTLVRVDVMTNLNNVFFDWGTSRSPFDPVLGGLHLTVANDVVLKSGGKIDVSEKGYAGGAGEGTQFVHAGYGPGGGYEKVQTIDCGDGNDDIGGGGGGYGGLGGNGNGNYPATGGDYYGDPQNPQKAGDLTDAYLTSVPSIFGSGGAGGIHEACVFNPSLTHQHSDAVGGRGGGSVYLKASKISIAQMSGSAIVANGGNGVPLVSGGSGGGSGGMIYLEAALFEGDALCAPSAVSLYNTGKTTNGQVGTVWASNGLDFKYDVLPDRCPAAIIAYGGKPNTADSGDKGGGGGGRISIQTSSISPSDVQPPRQVTVKVSWKERQQTKFLSYTTVLQDLASGVGASIGLGRLITSQPYGLPIKTVQAAILSFAAKVDYTAGTNPYSVATGDFNADGKTDLAVANNGANNVSILLGVGDGTFATKVDYATASGPGSVTTGDFNADGKTDLAVANYRAYTVSILLNNSLPQP